MDEQIMSSCGTARVGRAASRAGLLVPLACVLLWTGCASVSAPERDMRMQNRDARSLFDAADSPPAA